MLDDPTALHILAEPTNLSALHKIGYSLGTGHVELRPRTDIVGEFNAVFQRDLFGAPAGEVQRDFHDVFPFEIISAPGPGPSADAPEEVQLAGGEPGFHFDPLRQSSRETGAAPQHDDVFASRAFGWADDVEWNIVDFDDAEFLNRTVSSFASLLKRPREVLAVKAA
jgi:hypothetical protein